MGEIKTEYRRRFEAALDPAARQLRSFLEEMLAGKPRIDRITTRAKGVESFAKKAETMFNEKRKYDDPFGQIQDQIGARIIVFFRSDVKRVRDEILRYLRPIEAKDRIPASDWAFGYFGQHLILLLPTDAFPVHVDERLLPSCFELQIKTLVQHAWSEAEHDLGYKPGIDPLTPDQNRRLAFTSAQAWGADRMFDELFQEREAGCPRQDV